MRQTAMALILVLFLLSCAAVTNISQVEAKWGPPGKVEDRGDTVHYFWYFPHTRVKGSLLSADKISGSSVMSGTIVVEVITDRAGVVLSKRKYWKQPTQGQPARVITPQPM